MKVKELFQGENEEQEYFRGFGDFKETLEKSIATEDVIIPSGLTRDQRRDFIRKQVQFNFDLERMQKAIASPKLDMSKGLTRDERRRFISEAEIKEVMDVFDDMDKTSTGSIEEFMRLCENGYEII